jgi:hypothetical protein
MIILLLLHVCAAFGTTTVHAQFFPIPADDNMVK